MKQALFLVSALAAGLALTSCDPANQDSSGVDTRQSIKGLAVDGRVANGMVWVDSIDNNELDDVEPFARTDADGYYSFNPITGVQYCELPTSSVEYEKHCLVYGSTNDSMTVRIEGGIDLSTGEALKGAMAMKTTITESAAETEILQVLSPLTTLLSSITDEVQKQSIKDALGITSDDDLRLDFSDASDAKTKRLLANAVAVQTMMDILTSSANTGDAESVTQKDIIQKIADSIIETGTEPTLFNETTLTNLVKGVSSDTTQQSIVSSRLASLNVEINKIATADSAEAVKRQIKASEVLSQLVKEEASGADALNKAAAKKILDSAGGIGSLSTDLITALSDTAVEFDIATITTSLVKAGKETTPFVTSAIGDAVTESKLSTSTVWGGSWFVLRATAEDSEDLAIGSYIAVRLEGTSEASGGALSVCVNGSVRDSVDPEDTFENEYITGTWGKLSAGLVALNLDYEGQEFEGKMKAKLVVGTQAQKFRFTTEIDGIGEAGDLVSDANGKSALAGVLQPGSVLDCAENVNSQLQ
ncbi:hypothetical protein [Reinekea sp.]|jgi:hypothetical protein|uniref:hypothetical protein n=1 Tax=Reinekea sp. TaxID=1970455 RepID=UPI002A82EABA|nr:hypothetical protein [Reinekea sp.]